MKEVWKDIDGYEGLYRMSNRGRVKRITAIVIASNGGTRTFQGGVLSTPMNNHGYLYATLCKDGRTKKFLVHRLVADAFLSKKEGLEDIEHIDMDNENNSADNLRWCSKKDTSNRKFNRLREYNSSFGLLEEGEVWKDVAGYEGYYKVSNLGRVRSLSGWVRNNPYGILSPSSTRKGYLSVGLTKDGTCLKTVRVHRLVALAFLPNPDNLPQINHKDEDKTNNRADNLEWCTAKYNMNYGNRPQKSRETLLASGVIRRRAVGEFSSDGTLIRQYESITSAAKSVGHAPCYIYKRVLCKLKRIKEPTVWKYI